MNVSGNSPLSVGRKEVPARVVSPDGCLWRVRRSGRATLSGHPLHVSVTLGLAGKPGPEHEDSNCESSQRREQADRGAPGEPEDDETGHGRGGADERVWELCRCVIDELYARPDGGQDRGVGQRGLMSPKMAPASTAPNAGINSERSTATAISAAIGRIRP